MPISIVQYAQNFVADSATASPSVTVTLSQGTTAGNCVLVVTYNSNNTTNATISSCTLGGAAGNFGSVYVLGTGSTAGVISFWADPVCAGGQTSVVANSTGGSGNSWMNMSVFEVSGLATSVARLLDQSDGNSSLTSATTWSSSNADPVTTQATELWLGMGSSNSAGTITPTAGTAWNTVFNTTTESTAVIASVTAYQITSATGTPIYAGTASPTGHWAAAVVALFEFTQAPLTQQMPNMPYVQVFRAGPS